MEKVALLDGPGPRPEARSSPAKTKRDGRRQRTAKTKTKTAANRSGPTLVRCEFPHLGCRDCHITGSQSVPPGGRHKGCHSATVAPSSKPSALPRALPARSAGEARLLGTHRDGAIHTRESPQTCLRIHVWVWNPNFGSNQLSRMVSSRRSRALLQAFCAASRPPGSLRR